MSKGLFGHREWGLLFVVSAPAGTGKTTLVDKLTGEFPEIVRSVTSTTRSPRKQEIPGKDYHFLTRAEFEEKTKEGKWLESTTFADHLYGTSKEEIEKLLAEGKHVVLVIDTVGARRVRELLSAISILVLPPSLEELSRRLRGRDTETTRSLEERLALAEQEIACWPEYDYVVVNDQLEEAYEILRSIFVAEEHKQKGRDHVGNFRRPNK